MISFVSDSDLLEFQFEMFRYAYKLCYNCLLKSLSDGGDENAK